MYKLIIINFPAGFARTISTSDNLAYQLETRDIINGNSPYHNEATPFNAVVTNAEYGTPMSWHNVESTERPSYVNDPTYDLL